MSIQFDTVLPDQPRSWNVSVQDYLSNQGIKCAKATPLSGGHSAYIWRLDGYTNDDYTPLTPGWDREPCVLKYGDSDYKAVSGMEACPTRMLDEARVINSKVLARACQQVPGVRIPRVLQTTDRAVILSWAGEIDLRTAYKSHSDLDVQKIGSQLGRFIACVHLAGLHEEEVRSWRSKLVDDLAVTEQKAVRAALEARSFSQEKIRRALDILNEPAGVETLTLWDYRPMNTLLRMNGEAGPVITVVDLECATYGDPALDLRLWIAEVMILESKYGGERKMLHSFLSAYRHCAGPKIVTPDFVCKVAVVVGSMLVMTMPATIWECTKEDGEIWRMAGVEFIRAGTDRDMTWLAESCLKPLLESDIKAMMA